MKAFLATVILMAAPAAFAQTYSAAPPLAQSRTDVFDWRETPRGQQIEVVRAVFDSSGYLLTDANGQLISVPFSGNLYALQFGKTSGAMYFVNEGDSTPTLYLPDNAYLENAAIPGARWYPFPQRYFYTRPVYLGPAPSWNDYCNMGWYPGMVVYGGYWGSSPWRSGIVYSPMSCLTISIGTGICRDWDDFCLFGSSYTSVRPIIIRDTRPVYIDQRDYYDRSRGNGNDKNWDRSTYREPSRPGFQAPARHSEERAQGQGLGGADRFNYGSRSGDLGRSEGGSREREFRGSTPGTANPGSNSGRPGNFGMNGGSITFGAGGNPGGSREREFIRPTAPPSVPNMTPVRPSGGFSSPSMGSREREISRPSTSPGYSVPNMTPVRPGGSSVESPSFSRESREGRSSGFGQSASPNLGRPSDARPAGRTVEAPRESRESRGSSSGSSRESGSSSRERERGKK